VTVSILWIVLAASVIVLAMRRKTDPTQNCGVSRANQSGKALALVAIVYSLVLVAGFLYIGWQHGVEFIK
jgi:hypothetical protein